MKKMIQMGLALAFLCTPAAAEPVPPGPVCPDPCTEYHCTPQGICYCRPYPQPERCGPLAGLSQSPVLASFADEPAPDSWGQCSQQCKVGCCHSYGTPPGSENLCSIDWTCYDECVYNCTTTGGGGGGGWFAVVPR